MREKTQLRKEKRASKRGPEELFGVCKNCKKGRVY